MLLLLRRIRWIPPPMHQPFLRVHVSHHSTRQPDQPFLDLPAAIIRVRDTDQGGSSFLLTCDIIEIIVISYHLSL